MSIREVEPLNEQEAYTTPRLPTNSGLFGEWSIDFNTGATDLSFEDWYNSRRKSWADWAGISAATAYQEAMARVQVELARIAEEQEAAEEEVIEEEPEEELSLIHI